MRTTDPHTYADVVLSEEYAFDLPFAPQTIVDAGANIGLASIYFANKYPGAKIIAVEAEASNFKALVTNVQPYPGVIPLHAAIWNRDGEVSVASPDRASGRVGELAFFTHEGGSGPYVRAITMRTLMREMRMCSVDLLKVDIEGAEKEVFEACDWIQNIRCVMIELHDRFRPGCSEAVNSATRGFSRFGRGDTTVYVRDAQC